MGKQFLMKIDIIENEQGKAILLQGSLDIHTAIHLEKRIEKISIQSNKILAIDLLKVNYVDSSGVGCLIKMANLVKAVRGKFYITRLQKSVYQVFQVAGLITYFNVLSDEDYNKNFREAQNNIENSESV